MLKSWTFSQLEGFENCPKQYYHLRVARDVFEPPSEHLRWGNEAHKALELRLKNGTPLPTGMTQWEGLVRSIERLPGQKQTEVRLSIDKSFAATNWKTAWSRGIADVLIVHNEKAVVLDYKTGKPKVTEQLELYAAYTFAAFPEVKEVTTGFAWLKHKRIDKDTYTRDRLPQIWQGFLPRVRRFEIAYEENKWPARPSGLCNGWCPVKSCPHYKPS